MKLKELKEKLKEFDDELEVALWVDSEDMCMASGRIRIESIEDRSSQSSCKADHVLDYMVGLDRVLVIR